MDVCLWLLLPGECLPKAALRLSLADAQRTSIEAEELTSMVFNIRTRADGALAQVSRKGSLLLAGRTFGLSYRPPVAVLIHPFIAYQSNNGYACFISSL
jgi:hypothetical protein